MVRPDKNCPDVISAILDTVSPQRSRKFVFARCFPHSALAMGRKRLEKLGERRVVTEYQLKSDTSIHLAEEGKGWQR